MQVEINRELKELIPEYLESLNKDLNKIQTLLDSSNFEELKKESHKMKGHGGAYGFDYISNIASAMEYFSTQKKSDLIQKSINQLSEYLLDLEIVFI